MSYFKSSGYFQMESTIIMSQVYSTNLMTRAISVYMYLLNREPYHVMLLWNMQNCK